jgi:hypothetical protein
MPSMILHSRRVLRVLLLASSLQGLPDGPGRLPGHNINPERDRCPVKRCSGDFLGQKVGADVLICSGGHELVRDDEGQYDLLKVDGA